MELIEKLYTAIRYNSYLDDNDIIEAGKYGADSGVPGFTYNSECGRFFDRNEDIIIALAIQQAEELGEKNWMSMVSQFGRADMLDMPDGHKTLLTWFTLEAVGHWLADKAERENS